MLRTRFAQPITAAASSSTRLQLHTSSVLNAESQRRRQARQTRQGNLAKRAELQQKAASQRPHVVLGTIPGNEAKWTSCDLARILVRPEELAPPATPEVVHTMSGDIKLPKTFSYGIGEHEKTLLFSHLPMLTAEMSTRFLEARSTETTNQEKLQQGFSDEFRSSVTKANVFAKLVDLRNANARGIAFENRRRVIAEFSEPGKPNDTGRAEVQAALLTLQIRNLWNHLTKYKRDTGNRRSLRHLVHQRAKMLRYLKSVDRDRYDRVLERIGLEPTSVEGELVV